MLRLASCLPSYCLAASFSGALPRYMQTLGRVAEMSDDGSNSCVVRPYEKKAVGNKLVSVTSLSCVHPRGLYLGGDVHLGVTSIEFCSQPQKLIFWCG
jgi:hypothetical protein